MNLQLLKIASAAQKNEVTEYYVYKKLASLCTDSRNAEILLKVGENELEHAKFWESKTGKPAIPSRFKVFWNVFLARVLGLTFALKRMEKNEGEACKNYAKLAEIFPELAQISKEEDAHERELLSALDEERLKFAGSIVLGLNDALVELTGSLAGFTLALGETRTICAAGLITGISASFSMTASEYLSAKAGGSPSPVKSCIYTGAAYLITVALLIAPFFFFAEKFAALGFMIASAIFIIFLFNYYLSVAKDLDFRKRFLEMTFISLGAAAFSFGIGWVLNRFLGV